MEIPRFDAFLETVTEKQIQEWTNEVVRDTSDITAVNFSLSLKLLSAYHEWLRKAFQGQD